MFNSENFVNARFTNEEKNAIEVIYLEGDQNIAYNVEVNPEDPTFQLLMSFTNLDDIDQFTKDMNEATAAAIQDFILNNTTSITTEAPARISGFEFTFRFDPTNEAMVEELFLLKLEAFDYEEVMNSSNEAKDAIRNAQTPIELISIIGPLFGIVN